MGLALHMEMQATSSATGIRHACHLRHRTFVWEFPLVTGALSELFAY